jgi:hypothetical protein
MGHDRTLRIGIAHRGRLVEEHLHRRREPITIGQSAKSTISLPFEELPKSFLLFEPTGGGFALRFTAHMDGRVSLERDDPPMALAELHRAATRHEGAWHLPLGAAARGRISFGDVTVLFQLVDPPPPRPRPRLPPSLRGSIVRNLDWVMIAIIALSFTAHGGLVMYLRGVDYPRRPDIERIPDRFPVLAAPIVRARIKEEPPPPIAAPTVRVNPNGGRHITGRVVRPPPTGPSRPLAEELGRSGILDVIGARGESANAIRDLLAQGKAGGDADVVFRDVGGMKLPTAPLGLGPTRGGGGPGRVATIGDLRGGSGPGEVATGDRRDERDAPKPGKVIEEPPTDGDPTMVPVITAEIHRRRGGIDACYQSVTRHRPGLGGRIEVRFTLNVIGKLVNVAIDHDTVGEPALASCIVRTISSWRFPPSPKGDLEFAYPFIFQPPQGS